MEKRAESPPQLADMPVIVTEPGLYKTRSGLKVQVHEIKGPSTFEVKGNWFKRDAKPSDPGTYAIWHVSGRYMAIGEHFLDIVGRWA